MKFLNREKPTNKLKNNFWHNFIGNILNDTDGRLQGRYARILYFCDLKFNT